MNNITKITLGLKWGDNRFVLWVDGKPYKAFDTRAEAEAAEKKVLRERSEEYAAWYYDC